MLHGHAVSHPVALALAQLRAAVDNHNAAAVAAAAAALAPLLTAAEDHRKLAATAAAFPLLMTAAEATAPGADQGRDLSHHAQVLAALAALLHGQPDLVTPPKADEIIPDGSANANVTQLAGFLQQALQALPKGTAGAKLAVAEALRAIRYACTLHEANRQGFVTAGVVPLFMSALEKASAPAPAGAEADAASLPAVTAAATADSSQDDSVVREAARAVRVLTFDDDVRVAFGKGHEHARLVVGEHGALPKLAAALKNYASDPDTVCELCNTLARLAVRNEYCQEIVDLGGLRLALDAMNAHSANVPVVTACLCMLRAIAGNDDVKTRIRTAGGIEDIVNALNQNVAQAGVAEQACAALAALCLRNIDNSQESVAQGAANAIIKAMHIHATSGRVQTQACRAIRNIVARNRQLCTAFLDESAERYINQAMASHASCADDAKAALRDLGCKVELRELWTGMPQKEAEPGPGNVVSGPASEAVSGVTINVD